MHHIGIDIGTSSICGVVYDTRSEQMESVTLPNNASVETEHPWERCQSPTLIMERVETLLSDLLRRYADVGSIGVTGQMHGIVYVDSHGKAVSPLYTWQDGRGNHIGDNGLSYAAHLSSVTGYRLATGYGIVTHFYNSINHLVPTGAAKICTIMDYVVMRLVGAASPLIDPSNGASLGCFDLEENRFDGKALNAAGIDPSILPTVGASATHVGLYRNGIAVYSAIGDNQAAFIGSVQDKHKSIHITVGTGSQISVFSKSFVKLPSLDTRPFPGGGYLLVGAALCGGRAFALLKTFFEQTLRLFGCDAPGEAALYDAMLAIPYDECKLNPLLVETVFDGTRLQSDRRGRIAAVSTNNLTPQHLIAGFLQGISSELYDFYLSVPDDIKQDKAYLVGSGNGLKKNPLLCRVFEETFGRPVTLSSCREEAALGAARIAAWQCEA